MKENNYLFEKESILKAIAKLSIPAIIAMLVIIIYNVADTFFVGQTGNEFQVAAVSLTTPVYLIFMAIGTLIGVGGTSLISRCLGEGKKEKAKHVSSFCFYGGIVIGIIIMILMWVFMESILKFIGTSSETIDFSRSYLNIIAISGPFSIISIGLSYIIRSEGNAKEAMFGTILGCLVNIVLDPFMILSLDMGVNGAAIATLIGNIASVLYYVIYFYKKNSILSIEFKYFKVSDGILIGVFAIGIPAFLGELMMSLSNIVYNNVIAEYGDAAVAALGIAIKISLIIVLLQMGLGQGIQPLLGYNYGAKNFKRVSETIKWSVIIVVIMGSILTLFIWVFALDIVKMFIDNESVYRYGVQILRAMMISGPVMGIMFIFQNAIQAMGKAFPALILSITRQGLVFIPMIFILNEAFGFRGVIYAQSVTDFIADILAFTIYFVTLKGVIKSYKEEAEIVNVDLNFK
ncbi:MATE family efflux transporter [Clostridium chrysemydis]|uniref:MATE family efflux transporter n=1 Tax=Clostridium chrysemydis TaxID=2665504 RepID=UPI001884459D|nr:MATE family efflux transporter [Clostridium chrysemydis]